MGPVASQLLRAWERLMQTSPERCTELWLQRWFKHLEAQGAVGDYTIEQTTRGFDIGWEEPSGMWAFIYLDLP